MKELFPHTFVAVIPVMSALRDGDIVRVEYAPNQFATYLIEEAGYFSRAIHSQFISVRLVGISDGTPQGAKIFCDGVLVENVTAVAWSIKDHKSLAQAVTTLEAVAVNVDLDESVDPWEA